MSHYFEVPQEYKHLKVLPESLDEYNDGSAWMMSEMCGLAYECFKPPKKKGVPQETRQVQGDVLKDALAKVGFCLVETFDNDDTQAFLAKNKEKKIAVLAFRGTDDFDDWWTNFKVRFYEEDNGVKIHRGFYKAYQNVKPSIRGVVVPPPPPPPASGSSASGSSNPGSSDPGSSDPGSSNPGSSNPGPSDPGSSNPGSSNPGPSNPGPSDPSSSNPGSSNPGPSAPPVRVESSIREVMTAENLSADNYSLYITGHSQGGALALIATRDLEEEGTFSDRTVCYTFGCPRVGNEEFGEEIDAPVYRIVNAADWVPLLPPPFLRLRLLLIIPFFYLGSGYKHHGVLRYLTKCKDDYSDLKLKKFDLNIASYVMRWLRRIRLKTAFEDHKIKEYRRKLKACAQK